MKPAKTHCSKGHELTADNVGSGARRECLICRRAMAKARYDAYYSGHQHTHRVTSAGPKRKVSA